MLSKGLHTCRENRASAKELLLHKFITGTSEDYHGNIGDLIRVKKSYGTQEIINIFMKLFLLLPIISKIRSVRNNHGKEVTNCKIHVDFTSRFVVQEHILVKLNGFSGDVDRIDWENVSLNSVTLTLLPRHSNKSSLRMGKYLKEAISFIGKIVYRLAFKQYNQNFGRFNM